MLIKEDGAMPEDPSNLPPATPVVEMPWVLISNQIQQLSSQMNERFNDQRLRFEDRFDQIDKRFEQVDKRIDGLEARLTFRNSTWLTIIIALLTLVLGVFLAPKL
jgi:hypothetical protein